MKGKISKKAILLLSIVGILILSALGIGYALIDSQSASVTLNTSVLELDVTDTFELKADKNTKRKLVWASEDETVATVTDGVVTAVKAGTTKVKVSVGKAEAVCVVNVTDSQSAPILELNYNNVSIGLDYSFTAQASVSWKGEKVEEEIAYTWTLAEGYDEKIASIEASNDTAVITGLEYGDVVFQVSATYRGTTMVQNLSVCVTDIDAIFDSPNMELSAGCYVVNLALVETENDITSITPEIHVYDHEVLVEDPKFKWTNSDDSIAVRDKKGTITAKSAGTTYIVGTYKESELVIQVNVYRTKIEREPVYIEKANNYTLSFSELRGMQVEAATFDGVDILENSNKNTGTLTFKSKLLPSDGTEGEFIVQTDKMELTMDAMVVTMALFNEADLNKFASVVEKNKGEGYYVLAKDITCKGTYDADLAIEFKGTLDGRGNAIYNMQTCDRDSNNRGLLGGSFGTTAVLKDISFVNAKHSGKGSFLTASAGGLMENVYVQIDVSDVSIGTYADATSVLASCTYGVFKVKNVVVEYINPLPKDAPTGYPIWQLYHGYANYQGLYVIGVTETASLYEDLGGGLKDYYGAYANYGEFISAGIDVEEWDDDFWKVTNGIPYPVNLDARKATVPNVKIPEYVGTDSEVTIEGLTIFDHVVVNSVMSKYGIKVEDGKIIIPAKVPAGTKLNITVRSALDSSKATSIQTTILESQKVTLTKTYNVETKNSKNFEIDFGKKKKVVGTAKLSSVTVDGQSFKKASYKKGILKLDTASLGELGEKTVEAVFKKGNKLIIVTMLVDACTLSIENEADLNKMASMIVANDGAGRYVLGKNIHCTGTYDANITTEFTGTFDGHGYTIYNMTTSERDGTNRGLIGSALGETGVVKNVSFLNAKHGGKGGFITTSAGGTMENVYIQIEITGYNSETYDGATSILASSTYGVFTTKNVFVEYLKPLPSDATNGYAVWQLWHGYAKHQGLYVVGADRVANEISDLGGGLTDVYGAYRNYGDYLADGMNLKAWKGDFWQVQNKIPYPKKLDARKGSKPSVTIPEYVSVGAEVALNGATIYDRVILNSAAKKLGVKVYDNVLTIPKKIPAGTKITMEVQSVFDTSKKTTITTKVLATENVKLSGIFDAETYNQATFAIDFESKASKVSGATLSYVTVDGKTFARTLYKDGTLTLDTDTLEGYGEKTVVASFKKGNTLISVTAKIDVCTMAIQDETDLNAMAAVIAENNGEGRYVLASDIVCAGTYDSNLSVSFVGTFDGRGYAIYNMTTSDRDAGNRGLVGANLGDTGVIQNVSFVNAKHFGKGGFLVASASGILKNVYIQIDITGYNSDIYDGATSVIASSTYGVFQTEKVLVEYKNPLATGATNGYALWQLWTGYAKHQGLYVVGADKVSMESGDLGGGLKDIYGAYKNFGDFVDADLNFGEWKNDFWTVKNGIPYPKNLPARVAKVPQVTIPELIGAGATVPVEGITMSDRITLNSEMQALGLKVKNNALVIPKKIPRGTKVKVTVSSVFDSSKKVTLQATVYETTNVTLEGVHDAATYGNDTFKVDFGEQASEVGTAVLNRVTIDGKTFANATYKDGVLTLDTATLSGTGEKTVTAVFEGDSRLVTVTIYVDVCTMIIRTEEDLNNMASVITANNGEGRYVLGKDIECKGTYDSNLNTSFVGTFDGRGYAIYNMTTSDRDSGYRGLLGVNLGEAGVIENVSFINAKHGGKGGFLVASASGTVRNVYIQIDITSYNSEGYDAATSVIASSTYGVFRTEKVFVEYKNPLPSDATNGYAIWQLWYGYAKHQELYVVGADRVCQNAQDLGGGQTDIYGAYGTYGDLVNAGNNFGTWENDFWAVTNGIPYPKNLESRAGVKPEVRIPANAAPGSSVVIEGTTLYDRVVLDAATKALGVTVSKNVLHIPDTVPAGTVISVEVQSVFDETKKVSVSTEILTSKNLELTHVTAAAVYNNTTFQVDLTEFVADMQGATLISASVDGKAFTSANYENGILTLDTVTLAGLGAKTVSASFKATGSMISVTIPIDVCTFAIGTEADLNTMPSVITANNGDGRYILTADITCTGTYDANFDMDFVGTFDGCGYTIYNMTTSDRDAGNRGLLGYSLGSAGLVTNVSFVNAKHSGTGAFIATNAAGKISNVYIQIDVNSSFTGVTSVLASSTFGVFSTEKVLIEYINPLPSNASTGYAIWQMWYGYAMHQGLYVIGANRPYQSAQDLGGGRTDIYGAYATYDDFVAANIDLSAWENDFWTVKDGRPYPKKLK